MPVIARSEGHTLSKIAWYSSLAPLDTPTCSESWVYSVIVKAHEICTRGSSVDLSVDANAHRP